MAPFNILKLFIVVVMMLHLDADVRIVQNRIDAGNNFTECGETLVLTCYIENYSPTSTMTWQEKNNSLILVSCVGTTCTLNPAVSSEYSKSEDTTTGIFNLTIPTVTRDNNGISYVCENSLFTESSVVKVRDYRPILNETGETTLKVRSGCINRNDVHVLKFMWKIQKAGTGAESYDDATYIDTNATVDFCTHDTECGLNGFITLERTIEVEPGDASDYHLIAVISYDGFEMESVQTNKTYKIGAFCVFGIGDGVVIVLFLILFIAHLVLAIRIIHKICIDLKCTCKDAIISNSAAFAFLCMSIIVYCVCKYTDKLCIFCKNIDLFGIICGCLLGASFVIGIVLHCRGKLEDLNYNTCFFFTFLNLIIFLGFAVSDFCKKNKVYIEKPRNVTYDTHSVTHNSFKVQWKLGPASVSNSQNLKFFLVWYSQNRKEGDKTIPYTGNSDMEYVIQNLKSSTNYTVMIQAVYGKEHSAFTNPLEVRTLDIPDKPKEFTVEPNSVTSKSVWLSWIPGPKKGLEHIFNLIWYTDDGNERCVDIPHNGENKMRYKLEGLLGATNYNVKIFAECNTVKLDCDTKVHFKTKEDKLREFRKEHKKIAEDKLREFRKEHKKIADACEDEICCGNCKKTGASHASHAYGLSHELYLCLDCLEKEHKYEAFGILLNTDKDKICCGKCKRTEASHASTVYCLSHQFYLCLDCLEKEHKDEECVLLNTGNLFYCNFCQPKKRTPVVCYDLKTVKLRCWKCYILNIQPSTKLSYPDEVTRELHRNSQMQKFPCRVHEDDTMSPTQANVYCLVCKSNMCDSCFKKHIIKKQNKLKPISR